MARPENNGEMRIFSGRNSRELALHVCEHLGMPLGHARTESFPDGELIVRTEEDVRGRDCYVILSTSRPVNDNLAELLIFIDCLKRASAEQVTAVIPYFGYGRQDRKDAGRTPITAKLIANLITTARADRVLAIDLHAAQIQGFFDIPVDHLNATPVFLDYFEGMREELGDLCLVSPDVGNVKVAETMANLLDADLAIIHKRRKSGSEVEVGALIGSVSNKTVLMYDDMISTAGTICQAAKLVADNGAKQIIAAATHGIFVGSAMERIAASPIDRVIVSDTVPNGDRTAPIKDKLVVLSVASLLGDAIHRIHHRMSVSALFRRTAGAKR